MKVERKYKPNKKLNVICIIGSTLFIISIIRKFLFSSYNIPFYLDAIININYFFAPIGFVAALFTYDDIKSISGNRVFFQERLFETKTWNPLTWALMVLILFPVSLPIYLYKRYDIYLEGLKFYYQYD
jgi:hypothetical protein